MQTPKVLIIIDTKVLGGPGKGLAQLLKRAENKFDYILCNFSYPAPASSQFNTVMVNLAIRINILHSRFIFDWSPIIECYRLIKNEKINIIQSHGYKADIIAFFLWMFTKRPWISFSHGWTTENYKVQFYNLIDRLVLRFSTLAVVVSPPLLSEISTLRGSKPTKIIYNAVDPDEITLGLTEEEIKTKYKIPADFFIIGCFGRLSSEKGQSVLLNAVSKVVKINKKFVVLFAGDGPDKTFLEAHADKLEIHSNVRWCGYHSEMRGFYNAIDLLIIPSLSEGLPNVLLESMCFGVPSIATRVGAIQEVIDDDQTGWIVSPGNVEELTSKIIYCMQLPDKVIHAGINAKDHVLKNFSADDRVEKICKLYQAVLMDSKLFLSK